MIHSEVLLTALQVCQFIMGILLLNHYIACGWYGVGKSAMSDATDFRDSWVSRLQVNTGHDISVGYAYSTSLHWSLTQFTPASMEIVPCNTYERLYTIFVMLFSFVLFSSMLSSITTSMINLRKKSEEKRKQMALVRRYITDKQVTLDLGNSISAFLRQHGYGCNQRQPLHEDQIAAFKILPESLRTQMRCEVFTPVLERHPLFSVLVAQDSVSMASVCVMSVAEQATGVGEEVFATGNRATHMFMPVSGSLRYYRGETADFDVVDVDTFIAEAVLWVVWEHRGRLVATAQCDLATLSAASFQSVMVRSTKIAMCRHYAKEFHRKIQYLEEHKEDELTDVLKLNADDGDQGVKGMVRRAVEARASGDQEVKGSMEPAPSGETTRSKSTPKKRTMMGLRNLFRPNGQSEQDQPHPDEGGAAGDGGL